MCKDKNTDVGFFSSSCCQSTFHWACHNPIINKDWDGDYEGDILDFRESFENYKTSCPKCSHKSRLSRQYKTNRCSRQQSEKPLVKHLFLTEQEYRQLFG